MKITRSWPVVTIVLIVSPLWAATSYTTVDLGTTEAIYVTGQHNALNERGQVAGYIFGTGDNSASGSHPTTQAAIYSKGIVTGLGTLGGDYSYGNGANNRG